MAVWPNAFADHTFLTSYFIDDPDDVGHQKRHQRSLEIVQDLRSRPYTPKIYTTNSEVSRATTNVIRKYGDPLTSTIFINRLISSAEPRIRIRTLTKKIYMKALTELRLINSPYYSLACEFLDLT